jgi:signal transduction histidine kinase
MHGELQDTINMPEDAVWFSMDFARLAQYRQAYKMFYRILPVMDGYQEMPASGQINLTGMATGEYHVSVMLQSGNRGATAERSWLLYKKPIFTETQGFYLLVLIFLGGLTSFVLYERTRKVKGEKKLRKQISRDLHDEVGGLLTGISMQADLLRLGRYIQQADSVASISDYSREAIQMMDDIIWAIDARNNQKGSLGDRMKHLAGQMIEPLGLDITFDMDHRDERSMPQSIRQNLYLIYKEALHNICKHGGYPKIYVKLHVRAQRIEMAIRNEGGGEVTPHILASRPGQGTQNMQLRAEQIGGHFSSGPIASGYEVKVMVPLNRGFLWLFFND